MDNFDIVTTRLMFAILAGGAIGFERAYRGRPAGLRTHTLVCLSSCLLMLFTVLQWELLQDKPQDTLRIDPTRMAQGIMTGIGFLGAGVIMKDNFTIRGLTTAGSIWMTASIGIIIGMGLYFAAVLATAATLTVLSVFRLIEQRMPALFYGRLVIKCRAADRMDKDAIIALIEQANVRTYEPSYHLFDDGRCFRYEMTVRTKNQTNFHLLAEMLRKEEYIQEFSVIPTGD